MLILDLEGNIKQANAAAQAFYGRSAEALSGKSLAALACGESQHLQERAFRQVARAQRSWEGLIDQLTGSGARTVRLSLTPIRDAGGQICNILACAFDVHDLLNAQRVLQHERDRLEAILESTNDAVLMIDAGGTVVTVNLQFEQLFNLPRHIVLGRSLTDFVRQLRA
ncbi:MAG: PAS domain-containing protein [Chloroflexi bacterium]|nr:PAS domain-containing protein [Chloroflexota bacterium]